MDFIIISIKNTLKPVNKNFYNHLKNNYSGLINALLSC